MSDRKLSPCLAPHLALAAYRADRAGTTGNRASDRDMDGLRIAVMLEHAAMLPPCERVAALETVRLVIADMLDGREGGWSAGHAAPQRSSSGATEDHVHALAEQLELDGAIRLADALLAAWTAADTLSPVVEARVEAVRVRLACKRGDLVAARQRNKRVAAIARRERSPELEVRAAMGAGAVARCEGKYVTARAATVRAARLACRAGLSALASRCFRMLMTADVVIGDFEGAAACGWSAFLHADGDPRLESEALSLLGQLFEHAGHIGLSVLIGAALRHRARTGRAHAAAENDRGGALDLHPRLTGAELSLLDCHSPDAPRSLHSPRAARVARALLQLDAPLPALGHAPHAAEAASPSRRA